MVNRKRVMILAIVVLFSAFRPVQQPSAEMKENGLDNIPALYVPESFPFVRSIPLPLDAKLDSHLKEFRIRASQLHQKYPGSFIISLPTAEKIVALTFDDGPNNATFAVIRILNRYQVRGTFFFVGRLVNSHSKTVLAAIDAGHTVANHSWTHARPTDFDIPDLMEEIRKTQKSLDYFYDAPKLFRPPYGLVNDEQMPEIIHAGFKVIAWSVDSMDWYLTNPEDIEACVVTQIHPGAIILMHSTRQATITALPHIIEAIRNLGYQFVTIDEMIR